MSKPASLSSSAVKPSKPSSLSSDALKPTAFSSAKREARREQLARAEAGVREVGEVIAQVVKEGDQGEKVPYRDEALDVSFKIRVPEKSRRRCGWGRRSR